MTGRRRYHPFFALRFMRRTLLLYLVPLVQVLFQRDWAALTTALVQDAALFCLLAAVSWVMLRASSWELDAGGVLRLRWDLLVSFERTIQGGQLAAVQIERPVAYRLAGACRVTLYPALLPKRQAVTLCLKRRDAARLADCLMPAPVQETYHPAGGERLAFVLLGANSLSTLLLVWLALRQGDSPAEQIALQQLGQAAAWAARWLPAGLAWALTAWTFLFGLSLLRSFSHTVRYAVWRGGGVLASRGGLLLRVERRFRLDRLTCAEVRLSPIARLLRCYPVYLTAGCYCADDPLFVYRAGQEGLVRRLLPGFALPPRRRPSLAALRRRSRVFLAPAGGCLAFFILLLMEASWALPAAVPLLALPAAACAVWLVFELEGMLREGAWPAGRRLTFLRQRRLSLRCVCVFSPAVSLRVTQTPWAVQRGRANLTFAYPGRLHETVRSLPLADVRACTAFFERNDSL